VDALSNRQFALKVETRCNNRCAFCDEECGNKPPPTMEEIMDFMGRAKGATMHLSGGEPTLRDDLVRVVRLATKMGHRVVLHTNGRRLAYLPYAKALSGEGVRELFVSLHSADAQIHDEIVGAEAFAQTLQGIVNARHLCLPVTIVCVVTTRNLNALDGLVGLAHKLGTGLHFVPVRATTSNARALTPDLATSAQAITKATKLALELGLSRDKLSFQELPCCLTEPLKGMERTACSRLPHLPEKPIPPVPMPLPCLACALKESCSVAPPGVIPLHGSKCLKPVATVFCEDMEMTLDGSIPRFDAAVCRASDSVPVADVFKAIVDHGGQTFEVWQGNGWERVEALAAKNARGLVVQQDFSQPDGIRVLPIHDECRKCLKLHRCAGLFLEHPPTSTAVLAKPQEEVKQGSLKTVDHDFVSLSSPELERVENLAVWFEKQVAGCPPGGFFEVIGRFPLAWLGPRKEAASIPTVPWRLVDLCKGKKARLVSYDIDAVPNKGRFRLRFEATQDIPPDWYYERLGTVFILSDCPSRCIMCSVRNFYNKASTPLGTVYRVLEEFRLCGYTRVDYFGGEPTLRDDLPDIIFYATCLDCYSDIITNGIPLTKALAERLAKAGLSLVMVSLDAPDPELHDRIRGFKGAYAKALEGLKAALEQPGLEVNIDTIVLPDNYRTMARQAELAAQVGATHVNFFFCVNGPLSAPRPMWLSKEQLTEFYREILPEVRRVTAEHGITFSLSPDIPEEGAEAHIERISTGKYNPFFDTEELCAAPLDEIYITLNGDVFPCTSPTILETEHVMGNIFQKPLIEILNDEPMSQFRKVAGHVEACKMCFRCHVQPRIERRFEDARQNLKERLQKERSAKIRPLRNGTSGETQKEKA